MWSPAQLDEALDVCAETGAPAPVAAPMACSLVDHELFGATRPEQVRANVEAVAVHARLDPGQRRALAELAGAA